MPRKRAEPIIKISVVASPETEQEISQRLQNIFDLTPVTEIDAIRGSMRVSIYFEDPSHTPEDTKRFFPDADVTLERLRKEDWAESWKRHFKPFEIGNKLLVKPSWAKREPRAKQVVIILDPGLSFGTGQHPTTRFCLQQIVAFRRKSTSQSMLDIGTGSGILAIAAAKLGYAAVDAFDIDPDAIRIAKQNAKTNRTKINFSVKDLSREPKATSRKYDLICANLLSDLLITERTRILNRLKPAGRLILAGILRSQFPEVLRTYENAGLKKSCTRYAKEWQSVTLEFHGRMGRAAALATDGF